MKWEAVLIVTMIALAPEFCQVVVEKLLRVADPAATKALISRHLALSGLG
jgi:hypothetical protein